MAEKKIKEAKIAALPPVDGEAPVKKKRASGKRKPKPKTEDVQKEEVSLNPQQQAEEEFAAEGAEIIVKAIDEQITNEAIALGANPDMPVSLQVEKKLSKHADGWQKWLALQRMTPEDFIKRYPNHKMRHFIDEIIEFNAQK